MSEIEHPEMRNPSHRVTVDDVRALTNAATPHFSQHIRQRVLRLTADLPADAPARLLAESEADRLDRLAFELERG